MRSLSLKVSGKIHTNTGGLKVIKELDQRVVFSKRESSASRAATSRLLGVSETSLHRLLVASRRRTVSTLADRGSHNSKTRRAQAEPEQYFLYLF